MNTNAAVPTIHTVKCVVRPVEGPTYVRYADGQVEEQSYLSNRKGSAVRVLVDGQAVLEKTVWQQTRFQHHFPLFPWRLRRVSAHMRNVTAELQKVLGEVSSVERSTSVSIESRRGAVDVAVHTGSSRDAAWSRRVKGGHRFPHRLMKAVTTAADVAHSMQTLE